MKEKRQLVQGHLAALFTIFIWGTTFVSTKVLLEDFSPYEILVFRFVIAYVALVAIRPRFVKTSSFRQELIFAAAGLCGVTLYFLLQNVALLYTSVSNAGVIISTAPFFTALLAHFFLRGEPFRPQFFVGFAAAITGIFLISFGGVALELNPLGDLLVLVSAVAWAVYSILLRKIGVWGFDDVACTHRIFFYGILFMTPLLFMPGFRLGLERFARPVNLFNILFLGLGASAACFIAWNFATKTIGAVKTSVYIYGDPIMAIATSVAILHEPLTLPILLGAALTLCGLALSELKLPRRRAAQPSPLPGGDRPE